MRSFKIVFLLILVFSIVSCTNKTVELPQLPISGESEIQNHSQIWVFYKEKDGKIEAELNKNNRITTTHWIINIDKRLTLKELVPVFNIIKEKRELKSMHKKDGMNNYLSYSDIKNKKIALFAMDSLYFTMQSKEKIAELKQSNINTHAIAFSKESIRLDGNSFPINQWNSMVLDSLSKGRVRLEFSQNLSYQEYLKYRITIQNKLPKEMYIEKLEYVIQ
ncbi:MAG TPA: hypothetical protein EYG92_05285 [Lutibacter sp.]|nr:hypothetical protein [Lutibacter sp.]